MRINDYNFQKVCMKMANSESVQMSALARLFSSGVIREMARWGKSPMFARLMNEASFFTNNHSFKLVRDVFDNALSVLKKRDNRHEYVYKSALAQNILLGIHSLNTASMLTEFRVGKCKADVVILNGTASVYEIKSERDSLTRLENQVHSYRDVFAKVYVIAGENHANAVLDIVPSDVGILQLSNRHTISRIREASDQPERTNVGVIFDSIRLKEAKEILTRNGISIPSVPNTQLYGVLREKFLSLSPEIAHRGMVQVLKRTRNLLSLAEVINQIPESLQSAVLAISLKKTEQSRLLEAVNTKFKDATNW